MVFTYESCTKSVIQRDVSVTSSHNKKCSRDNGTDLKHSWRYILGHTDEKRTIKLAKRRIMRSIRLLTVTNLLILSSQKNGQVNLGWTKKGW